MYGHPGKKLLFMGGEFGQTREWDHSGSLAWDLLQREPHRRLRAFVTDLNRLYQSEGAFFEVDFKALGFEWLEADNAEESILAFLRKEKDPRNALLFAMNFSAVSRPEHRIGVPYPGAYTQIFSSNAAPYSGLNDSGTAPVVRADEIPWHGREFSISIRLPALAPSCSSRRRPSAGRTSFGNRTAARKAGAPIRRRRASRSSARAYKRRSHRLGVSAPAENRPANRAGVPVLPFVQPSSPYGDLAEPSMLTPYPALEHIPLASRHFGN